MLKYVVCQSSSCFWYDWHLDRCYSGREQPVWESLVNDWSLGELSAYEERCKTEVCAIIFKRRLMGKNAQSFYSSTISTFNYKWQIQFSTLLTVMWSYILVYIQALDEKEAAKLSLQCYRQPQLLTVVRRPSNQMMYPTPIKYW